MLFVGNHLVDQQSPTVLTLGTGFVEVSFSNGGVGDGRAWFQDVSDALHLSCTYF